MAKRKDKIHPLRDAAVLLLINGLTVEQAEEEMRRRVLDPADAAAVVAEARRRITLAADYSRDEHLGRAVMRLEDLYSRALRADEPKTALSAQRELNRLLGLYADEAKRAEAAAGGVEELPGLRRQLELIEGYLRPLALVEDSYPVEEAARVAAERLRRHGHELPKT